MFPFCTKKKKLLGIFKKINTPKEPRFPRFLNTVFFSHKNGAEVLWYRKKRSWKNTTMFCLTFEKRWRRSWKRLRFFSPLLYDLWPFQPLLTFSSSWFHSARKWWRKLVLFNFSQSLWGWVKKALENKRCHTIVLCYIRDMWLKSAELNKYLGKEYSKNICLIPSGSSWP